MRFPKTEVPHWAKRYSFASDAEVLEIGERSRLAGFYTERMVFLVVCKWKTRGRPRRHYERNSKEDVRLQNGIALTSADEETRILSLIALHGVSWPTASVFLPSGSQRALSDPRFPGAVVFAVRAKLLHV